MVPELESALGRLREKALQEGLRWTEPHASEDGESCTWFGNGPQGSEPARYMVAFDDGRVWSYVVDRNDRDELRGDEAVLEGYREYLRVNSWLTSST